MASSSSHASSSKMASLWPFGKGRRAGWHGQQAACSERSKPAVVAAPREPRPRMSRETRPTRPISLLLPAPLLVPPKAPLPLLPFELWDSIFSMAVDEHVLKSFFAAPKDSPFTASRISDFQLEFVYLQSVATMRSCALVNREWSDHATRRLYATVWVRSPTDAELLARTLAPTFRRSGRALHLQKLVLNVLVRFPEDGEQPSQLSRAYARRLASVVRNLPNLGTFLASDARLPDRVSKALTSAKRLTRGEWSTSVHKEMLSSGALSGLKSLFLQCPGMAPGHIDPTPAVRVELPQLHTLSVAFCRREALSAAAAGHWHMPALRHLSVCRCSVLGASFGPTDAPMLLRRVGAQLDQLDLNCAMAGTSLDLANTCPSLRTLLVSALSLPKVGFHPGLELVGLHQPIGFAPPPAEMEALIELLELVQQTALFPRIHSVRYLIPAQTVKRLSAHPDSGLRAAMEAVVAAGILLEDVGCNPIKFSHASSVAPSDYDWDNMSIAY